MKKLLFAGTALLFVSSGNVSAQYKNFESQPNLSGGYTGTFGNKNFDLEIGNNEVGGQLGGQPPSLVKRKKSVTPGNIGATQKRCYVDGFGNAYCE